MVIATWLCRSTCMATRGCTSSATSSEAQVRRVECTEMGRTPALGAARLEVPVEVERLDGQPEAGADHEVGDSPGGPGEITQHFLSFAAFLERAVASERGRHGELPWDDSSDPLHHLAERLSIPYVPGNPASRGVERNDLPAGAMTATVVIDDASRARAVEDHLSQPEACEWAGRPATFHSGAGEPVERVWRGVLG